MEQLSFDAVMMIAVAIAGVGICAGLVIGGGFLAKAKRVEREAGEKVEAVTQEKSQEVQDEAVAQVVRDLKEKKDGDCPTLIGFIAENPDGLCAKGMENAIWKVEALEQRPYRDSIQTVTLSRSLKS